MVSDPGGICAGTAPASPAAAPTYVTTVAARISGVHAQLASPSCSAIPGRSANCGARKYVAPARTMTSSNVLRSTRSSCARCTSSTPVCCCTSLDTSASRPWRALSWLRVARSKTAGWIRGRLRPTTSAPSSVTASRTALDASVASAAVTNACATSRSSSVSSAASDATSSPTSQTRAVGRHPDRGVSEPAVCDASTPQRGDLPEEIGHGTLPLRGRCLAEGRRLEVIERGEH